MRTIMDEVFYERQLELAEEIATVLGGKVEKIIATEYLYPGKELFEKRLSYSEIKQANRKKRINVTIVYDRIIPEEIMPRLNKIMCCNYLIYGNELWYSMKPERLDLYMRAKKA